MKTVYNWPRGACVGAVESGSQLMITIDTGRSSYHEAQAVVTKREALRLARMLLNFALSGPIKAPRKG